MRVHGWTATTVLALLLALVLAGCGGDGGGESEPEGEVSGSCEGSALAAEELTLPSDFPAIEGLTLVESGEQGPSAVADGFFDGGVQAAHDAVLAGLEEAGYTVTFDEVEADDSEVTYESPDAGSTGIVAIRAACGDENRMAVHITNRPA